ncbi:hypothetical protein ABPG72_010290 [Tetrahymena utriculariae]
MAKENYVSSNPDFKRQQKLVQTTLFSMNPIINQSASQNLSQNVGSNASANKSHNEQNLQMRVNQPLKQNDSSPKNQRDLPYQRQQTKQRELSFLQLKEPISGILKHSQTNHFAQQSFSSSIYFKLKGFFISIYTKKFVNILKQSSSLLRFKQMELQQFNIISDQASDYYYYYFQDRLNAQPSIFQRSTNKLNRQVSKVFNKGNSFFRKKLLNLFRVNLLIQPNSLIKICIDVVLLFFIILNLLYIPIELSFQINSQKYLALYLTTYHFSLLIFTFEILLRMNTAIYINGLIINDRKEITKNYLQKLFWQDLFIIIPFMAGIYFQIAPLKLFVILRFFDILQLIQDIEDRIQFKNLQRGLFQLFKLMAFIMCLAHLIACAWNKIAIFEYSVGYQTTWIGNVEEGQNLQVLKQYIKCIYWTIVTMTTLGYGDITPKTEIEQVFATSVGLLSTVIFAFSVSLIGEILKDISKRSSEFRSQMGKIETYLNKRKLNQKLKVKVRKYFGYLNKEQQEDTNEGVQLLQKLASSLKEEVFIDMYGRLLKSKKLFDLHFSQRFLNQLALKMKEMRFGPEEIIFRENDPGNKMYFILKGEVQMMLNMKQESQSYHNLCNLKEGQIFGEIEFFSGQTRENCARAINVTDLVYVEYDDFIEIVKQFPEDYEQVLQTKDNLNLYQKSKGLDHKCFSCSSYDHRLKQCPLVNFIPNKVKILHNYNLDHYQERSSEQQRKDFRSHKTLKQAQYLKQCVMRLHFKLYNEQLQNEFENSQFDFEGYSDENSMESYPSMYQQNSEQAVQKQKSTAIEKGFVLNNSFIAAETPKHQQRLSKLNTLLIRGASKHFSRSSTNKAGVSWSQNEHNSHGTHACLKQDSKSKFYKQTNFNIKVNSDECQYSQSPKQKSIKLQTDQKETHQSQKNEYANIKTEMPFIASPPISNIHNKSMKEESHNDDYNNLNPQMNILSNQFNDNFYKQNLSSEDINDITQKSQGQIRRDKRKLNIETSLNSFQEGNKQNTKDQDFNFKQEKNDLQNSQNYLNINHMKENLNSFQDTDEKLDAVKSLSQIQSQGSWRNIKNINFQKIKPNVLNMQKIYILQQQKTNANKQKSELFDSPERDKSSHIKEMLSNNYKFLKKKQNYYDNQFKNVLDEYSQKENITSIEEILSLTNSPQKFNYSQIICGKDQRTYNLDCNKDQLLNQQDQIFFNKQCEENSKEYAKPQLSFMAEQQQQQQGLIQEEGNIIQSDINQQFKFQSQQSGQSSFVDQPYNYLKIDIKAPESPPPAQENHMRQKQISSDFNGQVAGPVLRLLKVPVFNQDCNTNNSQMTNYPENQTTQMTSDKYGLPFDSNSQNGTTNFNESHIQDQTNTFRAKRPSHFQINPVVINKIKEQGKHDMQNSDVDISESSNSSDDNSSISSNYQKSYEQIKSNKNETLFQDEHIIEKKTSDVKPQINIIRDDEEIITDYKQFKKNLQQKSKDLINLQSPKNSGQISLNSNKSQTSIYNVNKEDNEGLQSEMQINKFHKNIHLQLSSIASISQSEEKRINRSYQDQSSPFKYPHQNIHINSFQNSPKKPASSYGQRSNNPSLTNLKLDQLKSSPCILPDSNNNNYNQNQIVQNSFNQQQQQLQQYNPPTLNQANLLRQNSRNNMELSVRQQIGKQLIKLKRTDTITTNNSPGIPVKLHLENHRKSQENIPAPGSNHYITQQNIANPSQNGNQPDLNSAPIEIIEKDYFHIKTIRESVEDFDKFKLFKNYFVYNNLNVVINQINKKRKSKAIVQRIHQSNIRKKKTLMAVSKLNLKRSGAVTDSLNLANNINKNSNQNSSKQNPTYQIIYSSPVSDLKISQNYDINSTNQNDQNQKAQQTIPRIELAAQSENQLPIFNSEKNLLSQKNAQRKSIFFTDKFEKITDENQLEDQMNLLTPKANSNFLHPNLNADFQKYISKSAEIEKIKCENNADN